MLEERLGNVSRRRERHAGLLRSNGGGVVEADVTGQTMRRARERKCVDTLKRVANLDVN